jgi:hypothetical protein
VGPELGQTGVVALDVHPSPDPGHTRKKVITEIRWVTYAKSAASYVVSLEKYHKSVKKFAGLIKDRKGAH